MSLTKNLVFVHIPKAGGTSVRNFIMSQVQPEDVFLQSDLHHFPRFESLKVTRPMLFMSHLGFDFVRAAKADAFILMRHPIERVLSLYSYAMFPGENVPIIGKKWIEGLTFEEFFSTDIPAIRMNVENAQTWQIASGYSSWHREARAKAGISMNEIITEAKNNLEMTEVVGTLEEVELFYRSVAHYFNNTDAKLPDRAANVSEKRIRWAELSREKKALVEACVVDEWNVYDHAKAIAKNRAPII